MTTPETALDGHAHTKDCDCLPIRVVVDQHGHYWRDYGDYWSMCPVSTENVATEPVTEFYRDGVGGDDERSLTYGDGYDAGMADALARAAALTPTTAAECADHKLEPMTGVACFTCDAVEFVQFVLADTPPERPA